jgi:protease-4
LVLSLFVSCTFNTEPAWLELSLASSPSTSVFAPANNSPSLLHTVLAISRAEKDPRIRGIVLNTAGWTSNRSDLWELRQSLASFKKTGKSIVAYTDYFNFDLYALLSVANRIVMSEMGQGSIEGYAIGFGYIKGLLDKLGIGVRELRYYEYKSAYESYTRSKMSQDNAVQYGAYLDDIFNTTKLAMLERKAISEKQFDNLLDKNFMFTASQAKTYGLVDTLGDVDAVSEEITALEGRPIQRFAIFGNKERSLYSGRSYRAQQGGLRLRPAKIAVVNATGNVDYAQGMNTNKLSDIIYTLADSNTVRAIVLRIDSPGGSADAAEYLAKALDYAKEKKPVIVSMAGTAASGGYWIAANTNHIFATPYTLTGSIGVIGAWFYDKGLNKTLGLGVDFLKRGKHSDLGMGMILPARDMTAEEETRYKMLINDVYAGFITRVSNGRQMDFDEVKKKAEGRVYSGLDAEDAGLVDSIGGIHDAINLALKYSWLPGNTNPVIDEYPKPERNPFRRYMSLFTNTDTRLTDTTITNSTITDTSISDIAGILQFYISNNGRPLAILPLEEQNNE